MNSYKVTFRFYDISPRTAYIMAENQRDAFSKAHAFITPDDDCCEIIPERVRKADVPEYTPVRRIRNPYERKALIYAEKIGIYEYSVSGAIMEYWSFYGQNEGWIFVRYDLESGTEIFRGANIPWMGFIPAFLKTETGATKYNYMCG